MSNVILNGSTFNLWLEITLIEKKESAKFTQDESSSDGYLFWVLLWYYLDLLGLVQHIGANCFFTPHALHVSFLNLQVFVEWLARPQTPHLTLPLA